VILLVDNYDSFSHNLARYFEELGESVRVIRNDALDAAEALALGAEAVVISPGPGRPPDAGISTEMVRRAPADLPILGVCLGLQCIGVAAGGRVIRHRPMHGKLTAVHHEGTDLFTGIPSPFMATRYHSLVVSTDDLPPALMRLARSEEGALMAARLRDRPVWGVQYHPEALLTEHGHALLANFLALARGAAPPGLSNDLPPDERPARIDGQPAGARRPTRRR
jgi:anthranilate synthase/aminodeoxychorismate synthase-like glutamine amidotransferase